MTGGPAIGATTFENAAHSAIHEALGARLAACEQARGIFLYIFQRDVDHDAVSRSSKVRQSRDVTPSRSTKS